MVLAPVGVLAIMFTPLVGRSIDKVDPRIFVTGGMLIFSAISFSNAGITTQACFSEPFFLRRPGASASPASSSRSSRSRPPSLVASASGVSSASCAS